MTHQSYYELLQIEPEASDEEIKRSYRKLAMLYHPDSAEDGGSEHLFQLVSEAYSILSDTKQREKYDTKNGFLTAKEREKLHEHRKQKETEQTEERREREENLKSGFGAHKEWDFEKENQKAGKGFSGLNNLRFAGETFQESKLEKLSAPFTSFFGAIGDRFSSIFIGKPPGQEKRVRVNEGRGGKSTRRHRMQRPEKTYHFVIDALESLQGTSRELALGDPKDSRKLNVQIPAGITEGTVLNVNAKEDGRPIQVRVQIEPHPLIDRVGDDITVKIPITIGEAINGVDLEVPTPSGPLKVTIPPASGQSKRLRLRGKGLREGDLYVRTYIVPPDQISEAVKQAVEAIEAHYRGGVRNNLPKKL